MNVIRLKTRTYKALDGHRLTIKFWDDADLYIEQTQPKCWYGKQTAKNILKTMVSLYAEHLTDSEKQTLIKKLQGEK